MSDLKICRICLCKDVKVYNYNDYHLKQYYEQVLANKVNYKDGLPHYFCYICAAMLHKFHKFKEKCLMGQKALKEMMWSGPLTLTSSTQITRHSKNLKSTIGIINVSKRVKTYCIRNISPSKSPTNDSNNSIDNKNLAQIKSEIIAKETIDFENVKVEHGKMSEDEKALLDREDDRSQSESENFNSEFVNDVKKTGGKEKELSNQMMVDNQKVTGNTEIVNKDSKNYENYKDKNRKIDKDGCIDLIEERKNKFESSMKKNYLDPAHWLKISLSEEEADKEFRARAQDVKYLSAAYKCTGCCKGYSTEDILNRHIKLRHCKSLGPFQCRFCNMRFKRKCLLTRHITQHYTRYKCLRCDLTCPVENTAVAHNEFHNGVIRKCIHCGEEFRHRSTYNTHLRTHRSEHVCTLCGASFISKMGLQQHKRVKHVIIEINPEEVNTYCKRCDISFETRKAYEEHLVHSAMHAEDVEDLGTESNAQSIKRGRKKFLRNPRKITPCAICNKTFASEAAYTKHHTAEHTGAPLPSKQRHICEICGASLAIYSIASHLNTHTREKPFTCTTCGTQFKDKSTLTRHQLTHTGEKRYECTLCDKRFTQSGSMKLHYRTFHLKEPYPKRNRRKLAGDLQELPVLENYRNEEQSKKNPKIIKWN